ncbi:hypothetical protein VTL71DRAFT_13224 [Oculimacula yallundae]|uniref:Uncharacterized protein n=1 Tax=Oculimacula yallundae TaxID=86028 RepID=A0ABR4CJX0_9HELO
MLGYREGLNDDEARSRAAQYTTSIARDVQYLIAQCALNGNSVLKRWKKESKAERSDLLKQAMPNAFPNKWCDAFFHIEYMQAVELESRKHGGMVDTDFTRDWNKRQYRDCFLRPYVDLEASWTPWEKDSTHKWMIIGFPKAILILEGQQKRLGFQKKVPGPQDTWKIEYKEVKQTMVIRPRQKPTTDKISHLFITDRLDYCLCVIVPEHDVRNAFAMLDDHLAENVNNGKRSEVARGAEVLFELLTDLSIVHQMLSMIRLHIPQARKIDLAEAQKVGIGKAWAIFKQAF